MQVLDALTGETVESVRAVRELHAGSDAGLAVATLDSGFVLGQANPWRRVARLGLAGFGILDAKSAPDSILVSVALDLDAGPSSVYRLSGSGEIAWRHVSLGDRNVPWLGRDGNSGEWLGIEHHVNQAERPELIRWAEHGRVVSRLALPESAEFAFVPGGGQLVATPGVIIDTATATVVGRLEAM